MNWGKYITWAILIGVFAVTVYKLENGSAVIKSIANAPLSSESGGEGFIPNAHQDDIDWAFELFYKYWQTLLLPAWLAYNSRRQKKERARRDTDEAVG